MKQKRLQPIAVAAVLATALVSVPTGATADQPIKTITAGAGLTGGGSGPNVTLAVASGGITNAMLANPALSILAGTGLFGGGSVALGGSTTLGIATGGVNTAQLAGGAVTPAKLSAAGSSAGQVLTSDGSNVSWQSPPAANAWSLSGNAGTDPATNFLGTTDNQPLLFKLNGNRALRLEPGKDAISPDSPNLIGGSPANSVGADVSGATIGGGGSGALGFPNSVSGSFGTVAGGVANTASGAVSTVAGGQGNTARLYSTVAGGFDNTASGTDSTVAGGQENTASGLLASVAGGLSNTASGEESTVAGGFGNTASGEYSFAAGFRANATHDGSFVWADLSQPFVDFGSAAANEFSARATGGVRFVSAIDPTTGAPTAGVSLAPGSGSWSSLSDRNLKRNFAPVDGSWILARLAGLPISSWSYEAQKPSTRHLGPTAQDFARAFGLGEDNRHIDTIDSEGVSLAGIKALYKLAQRQQREIAELKARVAKLERVRGSAAH